MNIVFNYGSNSTRQLQVRLRNAHLQTEAAHLPGFTRVFVLKSQTWDNGGVASIAPASATDCVHGSIVRLKDAELALLDQFEAAYRQERVSVILADERREEAIVYVAKPTTRDGWTPSMSVEPSEMYLNAVRLNLREHWPAVCDQLEIKSNEFAGPCLKRVWQYPGLDHLGMEAVLVEVNTFKGTPWVDGGLEKKMNMIKIAEKLRCVGCHHGKDLRRAIVPRGELSRMLTARGRKALNQDTLDAMRALLPPVVPAE